MRKTVTILGSTGSVGVNTLRVIEEHPEHFQVTGLAVASNIERLAAQIERFSPRAVYIENPDSVARLAALGPRNFRIFTPDEGLEEFVRFLGADILVAASSGTHSLGAVLDTLRAGKKVALANKEVLVVAGGLIMDALRENPRAALVPVDSEHSAIFQCLEGASIEEVERLVLTGSGGPLAGIPKENFRGISKEVVINHPKWKMGQKISVDSATMMNKGLEIIEASWLFGIPIERVAILIHPEAIIHSMVEFCDGSVLAQMGVTDMRLPIQYALSYPARLPAPSSMKLDLAAVGRLTFYKPDLKKFPCLEIAYEAASRSGSAPCVLSAADEEVVGAFLQDKIDFLEIPSIIEKVLSRHRHVAEPDLGEIRLIYDWAREEARRLCQAH